MFRAANGEIFLKIVKSKLILIRIFPTLTIKHQVLGSPLTGRDLLIGFDLLHQIPSLRWSSKGLMHKQHLLTWTQVPHLFTMDPFDSLKLQIISDCCANNCSEFLLKNPNPLWKNPEFFQSNKHMLVNFPHFHFVSYMLLVIYLIMLAHYAQGRPSLRQGPRQVSEIQ